jgi:hypothetical protein
MVARLALSRRRPLETLLLGCGLVYAVTYVVGNDVIAAAMFHGYDRMDQAVSELSAKGAVSRGFLVGMLPFGTLLMIGLGMGMWRAADGRRPLRIAGAALMAHGVVAVAWLWFPMTSRVEMARTGEGGGNDIGHLVMTGLTILFIVAEVAFAAFAFGWRFRIYSLVTAIVVLGFGGMVGPLAARLPDGEATPWMGLYERISIGGWLLWMAVIGVMLLRERRSSSLASAGPRPDALALVR